MFKIRISERERIPDAKIIQGKLLEKGLELSIAETISFWYWVSDEKYCAGWLIPDDETIEQIIERDYIEDWIRVYRIKVVEVP